MCGIFGVVAANRCDNTHERFLVDAFQAGQVRGGHGTGIFTVTDGGYVRNAALAVPGTSFLSDDRTKEVLQSTSAAKIVVGHNRYTTSGGNFDSHCHPFRYEHIIGVHNGGIPEHVLRRVDPKGKHPVDSARVFAALNAVDDPLEVLEKMHTGAYCLVWYDGRKRSLLFARNGARPMHVAETSTGLYFASELGMLSWLLGRNQHANSGILMNMGGLDTHTLYEIPLDDPSQTTATPYSASYHNLSRDTRLTLPPPASAPGNSKLHKYYQGPDLFGGAVAAVAYKRFYTETGMIRDFPVATHYLDLLDTVDTGTLANSRVPFLLLGMGTDVQGDRCVFGQVSRADGEQQFPNILASCRIRNDEEEALFADLLADGASGKPKEWCYPILPLVIRSYVLRPTGELIVSGELDSEFDEESVEEITWVYDMDKRTLAWCRMAVGPECLINITEEQLRLAWIGMKERTIISDDIPF